MSFLFHSLFSSSSSSSSSHCYSSFSSSFFLLSELTYIVLYCPRVNRQTRQDGKGLFLIYHLIIIDKQEKTSDTQGKQSDSSSGHFGFLLATFRSAQ